MNHREPPVAPYGVVISYDGCPRGDVDLPQAWGTREQCAQFIAEHLPPKGYDFDILCIETGRHTSYMIPASSVRRVRLTMQDITNS